METQPGRHELPWRDPHTLPATGSHPWGGNAATAAPQRAPADLEQLSHPLMEGWLCQERSVALGKARGEEQLLPGSAGADGGCAQPRREPQALLNLANGSCSRETPYPSLEGSVSRGKAVHSHFSLLRPCSLHGDSEVELRTAATRLGQIRGAATSPSGQQLSHNIGMMLIWKYSSKGCGGIHQNQRAGRRK